MNSTGDLEVFTLVAEAGSFSAAGRRLDLAPSSVARVIDKIEARLGVRLLLRTTRSLTLTSEGVTYLSAARRILVDLSETEQSIADRGSPRGRLRVSISLVYGRMFLVPLVAEFIRNHPAILIEIDSTDRVADVMAGEADVGVRLGPLPDSPLTACKLGETHKAIVASPGYLTLRGVPKLPEDLLDHDCIGFNFRRASPLWPFRKEGRDYQLDIKGKVEAGNGEMQRQLVLDGVGVARVCAEVAEDAIRNGELVPLLQEFNPGDVEEVHAVFVGGARTPARVRCFVDFIAERMRGGARDGARCCYPNL